MEYVGIALRRRPRRCYPLRALGAGTFAGDPQRRPRKWHGSESSGTGCALSGGEGRVKSYPVKVMDGKVCVDFVSGKLREPEAGAAMAGGSTELD